MIQGQGDLRYEFDPDWEQVSPAREQGKVLGVSDVATDSQRRVYLFTRSEHPIWVYDADGRFLTTWGEGVFGNPHGISIVDDVVYLADNGDHTVRKFTLDGKLLQTIGTPGKASDSGYVPGGAANYKTIKRGAEPFNKCSHFTVAPSGDLYVSDGYGNARVHRFAPDGTLLKSVGEPGNEPGHFNLPHSVWVHTDGRVFVCDRENHRVQIFSPDLDLLTIWPDIIHVNDLVIDPDGNVYLGEWAPGSLEATVAEGEERETRITVRDLEGNILSIFGGDPDEERGFTGIGSAHGLWVDNAGDVYVAEVRPTSWTGKLNRPGHHSIRKFRRVR